MKKQESGMFLAMPTAMRVWAGVENNLKCPVTVRDGSEFLTARNNEIPLKDLALEKMKEVNANELIAGVINTFALKVEKNNGTISSELNASSPWIFVDEMHFTNVIYNLLDNAVKYRDQERPLNLIVSTANISGERLQITIEDNGIGIKKEDLKRIFEKFYRCSSRTAFECIAPCITDYRKLGSIST